MIRFNSNWIIFFSFHFRLNLSIRCWFAIWLYFLLQILYTYTHRLVHKHTLHTKRTHAHTHTHWLMHTLSKPKMSQHAILSYWNEIKLIFHREKPPKFNENYELDTQLYIGREWGEGGGGRNPTNRKTVMWISFSVISEDNHHNNNNKNRLFFFLKRINTHNNINKWINKCMRFNWLVS